MSKSDVNRQSAGTYYILLEWLLSKFGLCFLDYFPACQRCVGYLPFRGFMGISHVHNRATSILTVVFTRFVSQQGFSTNRTANHLHREEICLGIIIEIVSNSTIYSESIDRKFHLRLNRVSKDLLEDFCDMTRLLLTKFESMKKHKSPLLCTFVIEVRRQ